MSIFGTEETRNSAMAYLLKKKTFAWRLKLLKDILQKEYSL